MTEAMSAKEQVQNKTLKVGDEIRENGVVTAIYAGLTADGNQQILTMPTDLDFRMTFNEAALTVKTLNNKNTLGHNDWQIPALENVHVMQKNQNAGKLAGTFKAAAFNGSDNPGWYWSSTENHYDSYFVQGVRFSDGDESCGCQDGYLLSCRPVRLVPA
jgi:hypothetical protein